MARPTPDETCLSDARKVVAKQAEDDGLWFIAETAAEAYLQQELRRLHTVIEGVTPEECAMRALAGQGAGT